MPLGMADIATVLCRDFLRFNPNDPTWCNRDRWILSNGHGSMLLYSIAYLLGYAEMTLEQLQAFRQLDSLTAGHPEWHPTCGIETTTGPLGQGLANGVGMALAERLLSQTYGQDIVNHHTYVFVGDGCLMEGISHEAAAFAGHQQLGKLVVFFDDNHITIDGPTSLSSSEDTCARFRAYGWHVLSIDGHNESEISQAILAAQQDPRPSFLACRTTIGQGAPTKADSAQAHGSPLGAEEIAAMRTALNWPHEPFQIPTDILSAWRQIFTQRCQSSYETWQRHWQSLPNAIQEKFQARIKKSLGQQWKEQLTELANTYLATKPKKATRQISGEILTKLLPHVPHLVGGSADLTPSNNTATTESHSVTPDHPGNYIHFGVREHAMGAIMNGLALYGGFIPYGGTFLTFSDYCRPAIRLSCLMQQQVIYVMTHDSIGLGEDGPTHQPIEHLASLRAMPNLLVMRPCDPIETVECWAIALESVKAPSLLALTRQALPALRTTYSPADNLCARGAYEIAASAAGQAQVTLLATGSEVSLACQAQAILHDRGIAARVVSMPCWRLFDQQPEEYRQAVLQPHTHRFAIEAASPFGWERYASSSAHILGIDRFGLSAPYQQIYHALGLSPEHISLYIINKIQEKL